MRDWTDDDWLEYDLQYVAELHDLEELHDWTEHDWLNYDLEYVGEVEGDA